MSSFEAALGRYATDHSAGGVMRPSEISEQDWPLVLGLAGRLFLEPTRPSRELAEEFVLSRQELVRLYKVIRSVREVQEAWTFDSPLRRRISFLRRELLPGNAATLTSMFRGEVCLPNQVEFHPALVCNLRCRACPNCQPDGNGKWHFIGYPELGQPLNDDRLRLIQDLFLEMGVESFSFGGGGEPSLSELTLTGIAHLRERSSKAEISLYTNGIFPESWGQEQFEVLVRGLNKVRFSIDAANAQEWSQYKGRRPELFETLWENIAQVVAAKRRVGSGTRIGASCLVSNFTSSVEAFLARARDTGLDFCDIKEIETCYGEKSEYKASGLADNESFETLLDKVRSGFFAPLDVVVDDNLLRRDDKPAVDDLVPTRCWVAIRGRMLTIGPYGELHPCSDAANPGSQYRRSHKDTIGQLANFDNLDALRAQFTAIWSTSLAQRTALARTSCAYCVPSHNNFNLAVEKLFQDWRFGILPEDQPFAGVPDHYQTSRGLRR
jgi:hypothetical protein